MINPTICFVAGKSGGHIIPCLTLAHIYTEKNTHTTILFFSASTPLDKKILENNKSISRHITLALHSIQRKKYSDIVYICINFMYSFLTSFYHLYTYKPSQIITTGGVIAVPVCLAGFILRIPITLYCLDVIPGRAIKAIAPFATSINVCFKTSHRFFNHTPAITSSYPIKYSQQETTINIADAQEALHLVSCKKTLVILGGSQGSLFLNDFIKNWINHSLFPIDTLQIIHQTGSLDTTNWQELYDQKNITAHVFSYKPHLADIYAAADLIICRAGAGTLFEIKAFNKKCIIIPLKTDTTDHQVYNARAMTQEYPHSFYWVDQEAIEKNNEMLRGLILTHTQ